MSTSSNSSRVSRYSLNLSTFSSSMLHRMITKERDEVEQPPSKSTTTTPAPSNPPSPELLSEEFSAENLPELGGFGFKSGRAVGKVLKTQAEVAGNNELNRVPFEYCRVHQCYHFPQDEATVDGRTCCVTCETK